MPLPSLWGNENSWLNTVAPRNGHDRILLLSKQNPLDLKNSGVTIATHFTTTKMHALG